MVPLSNMWNSTWWPLKAAFLLTDRQEPAQAALYRQIDVKSPEKSRAIVKDIWVNGFVK